MQGFPNVLRPMGSRHSVYDGRLGSCSCFGASVPAVPGSLRGGGRARDGRLGKPSSKTLLNHPGIAGGLNS